MKSLPTNFTFLDLETTGTNARSDRVIEVGALRVEEGKVVLTYTTLVNPLIYIPPEIRVITGITQKEIDRAPTFDEIKPILKELLVDSVLVAHNARFDYGFLRHEFLRFGDKFKAKILCTLKLSRSLYPDLERHNLDALITKFNLVCEKRHRAFDDASVLWQFYQKSKGLLGNKFFDEKLKNILGEGSLPSNLEKTHLEDLPEGPGVYIFYGKDGTILYIGKSVNIKERVKSHFVNDYHTSRDLKISREVARIEAIETAGELGALIREAHLIKKHQPVFNRKLRRASTVTAAVKKVKEGLFEVEIKSLRLEGLTQPENIMCIFKSKKNARKALYEICRNHGLCPKTLGLEKGKGACFNYHLGRCLGACCDKSVAARHNVKFIEIFSKTRIRKWPFKGPIAIIEESLDTIEKHFVDKWVYFGSVKEMGGHENVLRGHEVFDWDIYKIIAKIITKKAYKINDIDKAKFSPLFSNFGTEIRQSLPEYSA